MVGVKGFEPSTPCTPCKCATRLRHTPKQQIITVDNVDFELCGLEIERQKTPDFTQFLSYLQP